MSAEVYRSRWTVCGECAVSIVIQSDTAEGVPDEQEWHDFPPCPVCGGFLGSHWNADEHTEREAALRQGDAIRRLYCRQREVLDNLAQSLTDWHGVISKTQFLDAFDGGNEDLIPDAFGEATS